jgi:hypothetical protein
MSIQQVQDIKIYKSGAWHSVDKVKIFKDAAWRSMNAIAKGGVWYQKTPFIPTTQLYVEYLGDLSTGLGTDTSGSTRNASVGAAIQSGDNRFAQANKSLFFDGTINSSQLIMPDYLNLNTLSISFWIKAAQWTPAGYSNAGDMHTAIMSELASSSASTGFGIYNKYGVFKLWQYDGTGGITNKIVSPTTLSTNTWYHIVFTYQNGVRARIYINGQFNVEETSILARNITSLFHFKIGADYYYYYSYNRHFIGWMDDIRIYSRELTAQEVSNIYTIESQQ